MAEADRPASGAADGGASFDGLLEAWLLRAEGSDEALAALLSGADGEQADRLLRYLALNDLAEEGLDAIARDAAEEEGEPGSRTIGDYRLVREIASGGMGALYLAEDTALGRTVALKLLSRCTDTTRRRFRREAEITASLNHPNIVPVHGRGEAGGVHYIVMRYIAGRDIATTVAEQRARDGWAAHGLHDRVAAWCAKVADALHHAHEAGVIHRDVKPGNILIEDDEPYVVDFGLATHDHDLSLTRIGDLLGTVPYMCPEQVRGRIDTLDRRADVYGLGATMYHLLAGAVPFSGASSQAVARQILLRDPRSLRRHGVPRDLEAIVFKAMEKDRDRRYETAAALRDDLERYRGRAPVRARRLGPARRLARVALRHRGASAAVILVAVAAVTAAAMGIRSKMHERRALRQTLEAARLDAGRGSFEEACRVLEEGGARDDAEGSERWSRYRKHAIHDELMQLLYLSPGDDVRPDALSTSARMRARLDESAALGRPDVLPDRFRFLQSLRLLRYGELEEARTTLARWSAETDAPSRGLALLIAFREMAASGRLDAGELETIVRDHAAAGADDHYFTGLILALVPGAEARGLREMEAYLERRPASFWARFIRANILRRLGRAREAREALTGLAASLAPNDPRGGPASPKLAATLYQRAVVDTVLGRYEEALTDFERSRGVVDPWRTAKGIAHCCFRLHRFAEAITRYDEALEHLDRSAGSVPDDIGPLRRSRLAGDRARARAAILAELGRCQMAAGRWGEAEATFERIGGIDGFRERGDTLLGALELERAHAEAAVEGAIDRERFEDAADEIEELASAHAGDDGLALLALEARFFASDDLGQRNILLGLLEREDPEPIERWTRAYLLYRFVASVKRAFFGRKLPDDASAEDQRLWNDFHQEVDGYARRAADDLGLLEQLGFDVLADHVLDAAEPLFVLGVARYWVGQHATARRILEGLTTRPGFERAGWADMALVYLGRALEAEGRHREALAALRRALELDPVEVWALAYAGRLAARLRDFDALDEVFALPGRHGMPEEWLRRETRLGVYDEVRGMGRFARYFE